MPEPLSCPYCNAYVTIPTGTVENGQRLLCSRCGETFTYRGLPREAIKEAALQPPTTFGPQLPPADIATPEPTRPPWSNRTVAGIILGSMAVMAIIGVSVSLATQGIRREHDSGLPKDRTLPLYLAVFVGIWLVGLAFVAVRELRVRYQRSYAAQRLPLGYVLATVTFLAVGGLAVTVLAVQISKQRASRPPLEESRAGVRAVPPVALLALGYIPDDCDLVAGFHVAEINDDSVTRDFLKSSALIPGASDLSFISNWTGLRLQDIDHAVLGLHIQGQLIPRFTLVVRTLLPYDAEAVRKRLNVSRSPGTGKREYYRVNQDKTTRRVLWFADDHTIVVGLKNEDLEPVPAKPREGIDHLRPEISAMIKERLGAGTPLWVIGRPENWGIQLGLLAQFTKVLGQTLEFMQKVRTIGVWFQFTDGLTLNAAVDCADADAAIALKAFLMGHDAGKKFRMPPPTKQLEPVYQELGQSAKADLNGAWLVLQAKASAETLRQASAQK
jgi:hypothetical protein